jgi:hypothetical protein
VLAGYTAAIIWLAAVAIADRWLSFHKDKIILPANNAIE